MAARPVPWANRIVGHGEEAPDQLLANPRNWRVHPQPQQDALSGVLTQVGWVDTVLVNQRSGFVVDGHLRVALAISRRERSVPVTYVDLSAEEEALVLATLDPISAAAGADAAALDALLAEVRADDGAVAALLEELRVSAGAPRQTGEDPGPQLDRAAELQAQWGTAKGQLWEIPSQTVAGKCHRLLCGDSTDAGDVARLFDGAQAEMVWTDPPYGVAVGDKNKFLNTIARSNRVEENLEGDTLDEPALAALLARAFDSAAAHCLAGGAWYVAAPAGPLHTLFGQALKDRNIWRQTIQWVKNNATFAPLGVDYHWRAEPIFYGWLPGAAHRFYGGRQQDTVWEIDRPSKSPEHPTMKPVELVARAVKNSSQSGEIVYDPFLGSGTTLVAAEQLGRVGYGMELEPKYVAVALERLQGMGLAPRQVQARP